jgi:hypothetical protein
MMPARKIRTISAAALAAVFFLLASAPATAGFMEDLKKGWQDLKASFSKAPEEMKADGEKTWEGAKKDASSAAGKSKEAVKDAARGAKEGWEEVKDAVKSQ